MKYIVIEIFPCIEQANIVCNEDGTNKVFETVSDAEIETKECQDGIVVSIEKDLEFII